MEHNTYTEATQLIQIEKQILGSDCPYLMAHRKKLVTLDGVRVVLLKVNEMFSFIKFSFRKDSIRLEINDKNDEKMTVKNLTAADSPRAIEIVEKLQHLLLGESRWVVVRCRQAPRHAT
jgi:hypothetical protein